MARSIVIDRSGRDEAGLPPVGIGTKQRSIFKSKQGKSPVHRIGLRQKNCADGIPFSIILLRNKDARLSFNSGSCKKMKRFCGTGKHEDVSKSGKTSVSPSPVSAPLQDGASSEPMRPRGGGKIHSRASGPNTGHGTKSMHRLAIGKPRDIVSQSSLL